MCNLYSTSKALSKNSPLKARARRKPRNQILRREAKVIRNLLRVLRLSS